MKKYLNQMLRLSRPNQSRSHFPKICCLIYIIVTNLVSEFNKLKESMAKKMDQMSKRITATKAIKAKPKGKTKAANKPMKKGISKMKHSGKASCAAMKGKK